MDKQNDSYNDTKSARKKRFVIPDQFRIAYSINGTHPVLCTLIEEEPLFYIDEQNPEDDDDGVSFDFTQEEFSLLEKELKALHKDLEDYPIQLSAATQRAKTTLQLCAEDCAALKLDVSEKITDDANLISALKEKISRSLFCAKMLQKLEAQGLQIKLSNQIDDVLYDALANVIFIRPAMSEHQQFFALTREIRRAWQHCQGAAIHPLSIFPDYAVLIARAQAADLAVAMVRSAWEVHLQGDRSVWQALMESSYADLARAFSREAKQNFKHLNDGKASSAAFESWFLSDRCDQVDSMLVNAMMGEYQGLVFGSAAAGLKTAKDILNKLGTQPWGKNYLAKYARLITSDAVFMEVRDRSTANFLWFVKFERAFDDAEQELQGSDQPSLSGSNLTHSYPKDTDYDRYAKSRLRQDIFGQPAGSLPNIIHVDFKGLSGSQDHL